MTFAYTVDKRGVIGDLKYVYGTWTATGVTSGSIVTGLGTVVSPGIDYVTGQRADTSIDYTTTAGTVTLTDVTSDDAGTYFIIGTE